MEPNIPVFLLKILITNFVFGYILSRFIRYITKYNVGVIESFIYGIGLAPALTIIMLWYLLMLLPGNTSSFYFFLISLHYLLIFLLVIYKKKLLKRRFKKFQNKDDIKSIKKLLKENIFVKFVLILFLSLLFLQWIFFSLKLPIVTHDMTNYAIQGRVFFKDKRIEYKKILYDEDKQFSYRARHGYSFPLFGTWELIMNDLLDVKQDFYLRSIPGFYWILINALFIYWLSKLNRVASFYGLILLLLTPGFLRMSYTYSIDTYRIFFLLISLIFTLYSVRQLSKENLFLMGVYSGIMVNAHSMGVLIALTYLVTVLFFSGISKSTAIKILFTGLVILVFGGLHYILDIFLGTGWIFTRLPS